MRDLLCSSPGCLVIGEVAQAHDGSLGTAHAFIDAIAATGADAVKFQTHIAAAESTPGEPWRVRFSRHDESRYDYWKRMEFTEDQWAGLKAHAEERGLLFLSSPFSVEAAEMLDSSQAALQEVRERQDQAALARLQRFLHTLKGGARIAGLLAMGDFSHALETLLVRIGEGSAGATPAALDLVQRGLDELQQMRDTIDAGRALGAAGALIAQLEGFDATRASAPQSSSQRAPAAPARSGGTPKSSANTRPTMSPIARNGTNTPPHPPAATAATVIAARSSAITISVRAAVCVVSAHTMASPPGPTAARGMAMTATAIAPSAIAIPPNASRASGWGLRLRAQ